MDEPDTGSEPEERARLEAEIAQLRALETLRQAGPAGAAIASVYARAVELQELLRPVITVEQPDAVVVPAAEVRVDMVDYSAVLAALSVKLDELVAAIVGVSPPVVNVTVPEQPAPAVNVTVEAPGVKRVSFKRDKDGRITGAVVTDG